MLSRLISYTCRGRTLRSSNSQLASKRVFSVQPNALLRAGKSKRQPRGSLSACLQRMQPNLEHFKVNRLQRDKTAAGFVLYATVGVLLLK